MEVLGDERTCGGLNAERMVNSGAECGGLLFDSALRVSSSASGIAIEMKTHLSLVLSDTAGTVYIES
jgi:hypothetical protein